MTPQEKLDAALEVARRADAAASRTREQIAHARVALHAADRDHNAAKDAARQAWEAADVAADEMVAAGLPDPRQQQGARP